MAAGRFPPRPVSRIRCGRTTTRYINETRRISGVTYIMCGDDSTHSQRTLTN
ncbi:hypothetical protein RR46_07916 [Papilio xuthus]|uniref:Uncharacterized protein n=1 Tax=Papilio xuthus TaxID=66420 RepID=A0A194QF97_PAPXU|nr:hypothetical protein RR46_07916 [Papilio xuthus]